MKKKQVYHLLASMSLLGGLVGQQVIYPQVVQANQFSAQKGTFTVGGSVLNVRSAPSTASEVVDQYQPGQQINYDQIGTSNGYRWISYVGGSGNRRYVAIGTADGTASYGQLSGGGATPTAPAMSSNLSSLYRQFSQGDFSYLVGTWKNGDGRGYTISADGYVTYLQGAGHGELMMSNGELSMKLFQADGSPVLASGIIPMPFALAGEAMAGLRPDNSDQSRERLLPTQSVVDVPAANFFYRDSPAPAIGVELSKLAGTWKNAKGDVVTISSDGKFSGKTIYGEKANLAITPVMSNFSGLSNYQVDNTGFYYDPKQDAVLIYTHSEFQPTPGHDFFYTRVDSGKTSSSSENSSKAFADLAGKWINAKGEEVTITDDGIVTQVGTDSFESTENGKVVATKKVLQGQTIDKGLISGQYLSGVRFNNYYIYSPAGTQLIDKFRKDEDLGIDEKNDRLILVRAETAPHTTPIEEFLFTRVAEKEEASSQAGSEKAAKTSAVSSESGNALQRFYQQLTNRKDLPSTGEAVSVLGLIGAALTTLVIKLKKRFSKQ